jgi:lipid-A-disaccharide synthase
MANLIAGRRVVPELIQHEFTAANVVAALKPLLNDGPAREESMAALREVRALLHTREGEAVGERAIDRVARICAELLDGGSFASSKAKGEPEPSVMPAGTYPA